ncbi:MAG: S-layer homology domain-containing protein [Defluviitaleaceae bacterium]|nr:S-layer homology domain-containing protein [Defluviitaleaceae bacterium]
MKQIKRFLSTALVLILVLTVVPAQAIPETQIYNEYKSEIERRFSVRIDLRDDFDNILSLAQIDSWLAMIPPALHTALVTHFRAKNQTITIRRGVFNSGHPAFYQHSDASINFEDGFGDIVFLHEYGHMVHEVIWEILGRQRFNREFGSDADAEHLADIFEGGTEMSYRRGFSIEEERDYIGANYSLADPFAMFLLESLEDTVSYNRIASAALRIDSIFHPSYGNPHTPSTWAVEAVNRAFYGTRGFLDGRNVPAQGIIDGAENDRRIYQLAINRGEFAEYAVRVLDNIFEKNTGQRLITYDSGDRIMLLDLATRNYVYADEFSQKPLRKFDDLYFGNEYYITIAEWYGIVSGVGNNRFNPRGELTREQAAVILQRAASLLGLPDNTTPASAPTDAASISSWAAEGAAWAMRNGIMAGTGGGNFSPQEVYTFEQAIVTLVRIFDSVR